MLEIIKKTILLSIGLASLTKEKIEDLAKEISKNSKLTEEEGKKLFDDLLKKSEEAKSNLEKQVNELIKNALKKVDIPSHEDFQKLKKRIKKLEESKKN